MVQGTDLRAPCDLSPSGDLPLYFAAKYKEPLRSWTAISKPPFLTALAMWAKGDGWGGSGPFDTELSIQLSHRPGEALLAEEFRLKKNMRNSELNPCKNGLLTRMYFIGLGNPDTFRSPVVARAEATGVPEISTLRHL